MLGPHEPGREPSSLLEVVQADVCIGCGACAVVTKGAIPVRLTTAGYLQADLSQATGADLALGSRVCPFADQSPDETAVADAALGDVPQHDDRLGRYRETLAMRLRDDTDLKASSSGGVTSWLLARMLDSGLVDGVIHVGSDGPSLFSYTISRTSADLLTRRKSVYFPTTMADVLQAVRGDGHAYAIVGVPCFITAARHLAHEDPALGSQLRYFVGLVCGHLKSQAFAEVLAWQAGIVPAELAGVDFRVKVPGRDAGDYDFSATASDGTHRTARTQSLLGSNWGHGMFQLNACNYCDDVFAETADVVFGDAWLPEYRSDWRGTNIVVTRHGDLAQLLHAGVESGALWAERIGADRAALSQAGNFRHRRDGLALRLHDDMVAGRWAPKKRVEPSDAMPDGRKALVRLRRQIGIASHGAYARAREASDLQRFRREMRPLVAEYDRRAEPSFLRRLKRRIGRMVRR